MTWLAGSEPMAFDRRRLSICSTDNGTQLFSRDRTRVRTPTDSNTRCYQIVGVGQQPTVQLVAD